MTKMNPRGWETLTEEEKSEVAQALIDMEFRMREAMQDAMDAVVKITCDVDFATREIARYSPTYSVMRIREDILAEREEMADA